MTEQPQTYLITPPTFEPEVFAEDLAKVMDAIPVACVRLTMASRDEDEIARAADTLRAVCHDRDVSIVVTDHLLLAQRLGLDGVHLSSGTRGVRDARKAMGIEGIVGSFCGTSRHDGMTAGEAGADYISFGPVGGGGLGDGALADREIFEWWSQMIELPVVAEGGLTPAEVRELAPFTDFFGFGTEIWTAEDPVAALRTLRAAMADG